MIEKMKSLIKNKLNDYQEIFEEVDIVQFEPEVQEMMKDLYGRANVRKNSKSRVNKKKEIMSSTTSSMP
jgi:hypothetical protein